MGPFIVTAGVSDLAYHLDLVGQFSHVHSMFHASLLRRLVISGHRVAHPEYIDVKDT